MSTVKDIQKEIHDNELNIADFKLKMKQMSCYPRIEEFYCRKITNCLLKQKELYQVLNSARDDTDERGSIGMYLMVWAFMQCIIIGLCLT